MRVRRVLLNVLDAVKGDLDTAQANVEAWLDPGMDRVSDWYKRPTSKILFVIGLSVTIVFNVNTITVADFLLRNDAARGLVVVRAEKAGANADFIHTDYTGVKTELRSLRLPVGWDEGWARSGDLTSSALGTTSSGRSWDGSSRPYIPDQIPHQQRG